MFKFLMWQKYVLGFTALMLLCLVGSYDYDEALASEKLYCDMTTEGSWPSYDSAIDCDN
ncbi:hypothetical protein [Pseudomonas phage vB_PsaM_M1]|nr:hypothetical protein [Pseudomonas phage vB_PsaM_M1]